MGDSESESSVVYTAPRFFFEFVCGRSNWSLPRLPLHMHAEEIIPMFVRSNVYIGLCHSQALTLIHLHQYEMIIV